MPDTYSSTSGDTVVYTAGAGLAEGEVVQLPDGRCGIIPRAVSSGGATTPHVTGNWLVTKTAGVVLLDGQKVYWDHSANAATYKKANDRDFYIGRAMGDAASASTVLSVSINVNPKPDIDLLRDPFATTFVGTQALGGLALLQRGSLHAVLSSTNEAQKVDALSVDGFATAANAIIDFTFRVPSDGAGTNTDVSIGVANGTHASDADAITESVFIHLNGNSTTIYAESDDNSTEVAATDTTATYTEGSAVANRVYGSIDMRNPADVQIYLNGANVLPSTVFDVSAATGPWKLLFHVEKSSSTDTYEIVLDQCEVRFME